MSRQGRKYPRLGEQIDRLVHSLVATKGWEMASAMSHICQHTSYSSDMVYRWRQGKLLPSPDTLEILAEIGKKDANLSREWGESMLNAANYKDTISLVNKLWGPKEVKVIPCNLPSGDGAHLIGRQTEIARLLELLSPERAAPLITVDGIGGVGKTALVLEVASRCFEASSWKIHDPTIPHFEAIIFVSAKQQYLTPDGILSGNDAKRTLRDIYREIAVTLERFEIMHAIPQEQLSVTYKVLSQQRTLLIVDNLETMEDKQEIMSFLYYELPRSVKVIITTRERLSLFSTIRLEQLSQQESLSLIEKEVQGKDTKVSRAQALKLYHHIGGIPAALIYAIGQIAFGYSVETVVERVPKAGSDVARFCFEGSLGPLRGQPAHHLLMAIAMFPKPPLFKAIAETAGLRSDKIAVEDGLTQLHRLSLVSRQEGRYSMLPLTREYALSELAAHAPFEQEARMRWVNWYLSYTEEYGGKDWGDWHIQYDPIEEEWENLLTVFDWCATHEWYDAFEAFWQKRHLVKFAHIYGHWNDRLLWLDWLVQAAEKRGDWSCAVRARVDIGATLTLVNQFDEANWHFERAWEKHRYVDNQVLVLLTQKIAELRIYQKDYADALVWLEKAETLLKAIESGLSELERTRRLVDLQSRWGLFFYKQKDYDQAKVYYQEMFEGAKRIKWQRNVIYAQNYLAYIAIAQDRLDEAEVLLQSGLPIEKDKRATAFHKYTYACFYQKQGNLEEFRRLAKEAFDGYEDLGMKLDAQEVEELLRQLSD